MYSLWRKMYQWMEELAAVMKREIRHVQSPKDVQMASP